MMRSLVGLSLLCASITLLTVSCGSDELTSDDDGSEGGDDGQGSGGTSASGGRAGGSTNAGRGGASSPSSSLGSSCSETTSCGADLQCLIAGDIPGGLCTAECSSDEDCRAFGALAVCLPEGGGICFEGCQPNSIGAKCHQREDLVCGIYDVVQRGACDSDSDCTGNAVCLGAVCRDPFTACLPSCGSDADCGEGLGCDLSTGSCRREPKQGLPVGSPCTPGVSANEDPCSGFCLRYGDGDEDGFCSGSCRTGFSAGIPGCGFSPDSKTVEAACLFLSAYFPRNDDGNSGLCSQLCDCDADCLTPGFSCIDFPVFGRRGQCAPLTASDTASGITNIPDCDGGGGTGAGGEGGAAGASGAGGSGGFSEGGIGGSTDAGAGQGATPGSADAGSGGTTG